MRANAVEVFLPFSGDLVIGEQIDLTAESREGRAQLMGRVRDELLHQFDASAQPIDEAVDFCDERHQLARRRHADKRQVERVTLSDGGLQTAYRRERTADGENRSADRDRPHHPDKKQRAQRQFPGQGFSGLDGLRDDDDRIAPHLWIVETARDPRHADDLAIIGGVFDQRPSGRGGGGLGVRQIGVAGHGLAGGVEHAVENTIPIRQSEKLEGGYRQLDFRPAFLNRYGIRDLIGRAEQQPIISLVSRLTRRIPGDRHEHRRPEHQNERDQHEQANEERRLTPRHRSPSGSRSRAR